MRQISPDRCRLRPGQSKGIDSTCGEQPNVQPSTRRSLLANGRTPEAIVIGNHGIFVVADTPEACIALHASWVSRCEEHFAKAAPSVA